MDPWTGFHYLVSLMNEQIISNDVAKVVQDGVIGDGKWDSAFVCFLFGLHKAFPVFCVYLIKCRLHGVGFIASITRTWI